MSNVECRINKKTNSGILYVVATPIGNLEDITLRALRILKEVDYILCEDKRITVRLLNKYNIKTKLISFHKFNEVSEFENVLSLLKGGKNIALVSDSGTPLISDPGYKLIYGLREQNTKIVPIPGPSSLTCALSLFGIESNEFLYIGFLPAKRSKRRKIIASLKDRAKTIILFIAPHDFKKYLNEIYEFYPEIRIFYARELTKIYEDHYKGSIQYLLSEIEDKTIKGEIVLGLYFWFFIFCLQIV